jgi:hypothetical protein
VVMEGKSRAPSQPHLLLRGRFKTRQANPYSKRTGYRLMLNRARAMMPCVGGLGPKAQTLGDSCMTADIHSEEGEK